MDERLNRKCVNGYEQNLKFPRETFNKKIILFSGNIDVVTLEILENTSLRYTELVR